jgi:anti-sigma factor RsiW
MFNYREDNMDCTVSARMMNPYIDGELGEKSHEIFEGHIGVCAKCRAELAELNQLDGAIRGLDPIRISAGFTALVMAGVREREKGRLSWKFGYVYSLVFMLFFILGILIGPLSDGGSGFHKSSRDLTSILVDGQKFTSPLDESSVIISLTGGTDEERTH